MLFGFLVTLFVFVCLLLVFLILIQQSKSSMGLGSMGGGQQMLFGGSGGQDIFQKITWFLGALFIFGSLTLSIMKSTGSRSARYIGKSNTTQLPLNESNFPAEQSTQNP